MASPLLHKTLVSTGVTVSVAKVLIVDDDEESRRLLCEVLEANGYAADAVEDGAAARAALSRDGGYRIILADLRMPKVTGLELLRNLREQNSKHEIILMSSFISAKERKVAEELGVHAMLEKPFRLSDLLQLVAELAGKDRIGISP